MSIVAARSALAPVVSVLQAGDSWTSGDENRGGTLDAEPVVDRTR
jgi:hypothetical protein